MRSPFRVVLATAAFVLLAAPSPKPFRPVPPTAVAADRRATGGRAVPARCGSPSCDRPESSNCRQPASTASWLSSTGAGAG